MKTIAARIILIFLCAGAFQTICIWGAYTIYGREQRARDYDFMAADVALAQQVMRSVPPENREELLRSYNRGFYHFVLSKRGTSWRGFTGSAQLGEIVDVIQADVFETKMHGPISAGHNALAGLIYFFTFLAFVFQTITGFALYSSMSNSWLPRMFTWIVPLMGGEFGVRFWHHTFLWFFVTFIIIHIYLAFYHDYIEGRGTVSSIIGGWKFEREKNEK